MSCYCNTFGWDPSINVQTAVETDDTKMARYTSAELAACRAENLHLKQKLIEYEATIRNLECMVTSIADKQQQILIELREENRISPIMFAHPGPNMPDLENDDGEMGDDEGDDEILSQSSALPSDIELTSDSDDDDELQVELEEHSSDADSELN
ncbi:uncharacterized protein Dwil_GK10858 [Drosophila willistoni]|uniref:Uncharacterized protein n=1 Tax=Drosophila willistoni TaxID=7260 RepID=B4N9X2_DROWI|nr:uncharacterized protein LOC6647609 isoform X2 [Drosophila willistoni]EDW81727.2 uncharacterized protein Dwil_GK10858 [Drosophila willistoni]